METEDILIKDLCWKSFIDFILFTLTPQICSEILLEICTNDGVLGWLSWLGGGVLVLTHAMISGL